MSSATTTTRRQRCRVHDGLVTPPRPHLQSQAGTFESYGRSEIAPARIVGCFCTPPALILGACLLLPNDEHAPLPGPSSIRAWLAGATRLEALGWEWKRTNVALRCRPKPCDSPNEAARRAAQRTFDDRESRTISKGKPNKMTLCKDAPAERVKAILRTHPCSLKTCTCLHRQDRTAQIAPGLITSISLRKA